MRKEYIEENWGSWDVCWTVIAWAFGAVAGGLLCVLNMSPCACVWVLGFAVELESCTHESTFLPRPWFFKTSTLMVTIGWFTVTHKSPPFSDV